MQLPLSRLVLLGLAAAAASGTLQAQTVQPPFDASYTLVSLGTVPGLPGPSGGLTFSTSDPDTLLVGGEANEPSGGVYAIRVNRDAAGHVTGFSGTATFFATAAFNDGGMAYAPAGVLFVSRWPENELGQTRPGSAATDKVVDLGVLGVSPSPGGLNFVPTGFPAAGSLKVVSWEGGEWYSLGLTADGTGTFNVTSAALGGSLPGGPEGFAYVTPGSPQFTDYQSMVLAEWSSGNVVAYTVDANANPVPASRRLFVTGLSGPEGAAVDPRTGDFLFSSLNANDQNAVMAVRGFAPPPQDPSDPGDPEPTTCHEPHPVGHGYWQRQCLGMPGPNPRGNGRGPQRPTEPGFAAELVPCADAWLASLGFEETTCGGIDANPPNQTCERALRSLTSLALNVCSDRVQTGCAVAATPGTCDAADVGELLEAAAQLIEAGSCRQAEACLARANDGVSGGGSSSTSSTTSRASRASAGTQALQHR
ncbi:MAG TPA: hypothetical protein VJS92_17565 [Candidatus Polarisedimenticolaceae bacterium]|nr:hypothetical protein [Candidatus Polarisedimenticolaceae bacterium]